ncbi:MAG: glycosyltransferase family 4 protein [Clostridia bacterium]|nr:glycosyltransferase family 4 protein [Clostridia bacterium]
MKILYFCTFYHRALLFRQQMDALIKRGHYVRAFSSAKYGEGVADKFLPIMDELVVHKECWNKYDRTLFFPRQWKIEKELQKAYNLKDFDLVHAHLLLSSGYSALRMKKKYGTPYVVSVRVTDLTGFIKLPYFRKMALKIIKNSSGVLFLSHSHKKEFEEKYLTEDMKSDFEKKSVVIGNSLEPFWEEHLAKPRKSVNDFNNIKLLSVAKIRPIKNLTVACEAVEELNRRGVQATLTIVGEVQDREEYEKILKYEHTEVLPFKTKEELITIYGNHDIFLLPSVNETFGRVYAEAMTQGLPILYTRKQGFDNNFPDGKAGYSVYADNPEFIADRVQDILANYEEISRFCIENSTLFFEDNIMNQIEKFYQNSLTRG